MAPHGKMLVTNESLSVLWVKNEQVLNRQGSWVQGTRGKKRRVHVPKVRAADILEKATLE